MTGGPSRGASKTDLGPESAHHLGVLDCEGRSTNGPIITANSAGSDALETFYLYNI